MEADKNSVMWELTGGKLENANGRTAFDGMRKGDKTAKNVVDNYIDFVSCGITNVVNIFQPEVLCVGGGISNEGETLMAPIREFVVRERYSKNVASQTELRAAQLGNDAGIIGAASLYNLAK